MNYLYIITILSKLGTFIAILGLICILIGVIMYGITIHEAYEYNTEEEKEEQKRYKIKANKLFIVGFISLLLYCFIPSTKEMYIIYDAGGTIDYINGNEKVKESPDKVVGALDKYLEEYKGDKE